VCRGDGDLAGVAETVRNEVRHQLCGFAPDRFEGRQ